MKKLLLGFGVLLSSALIGSAFTVFEATGADPTAITPTRDFFRSAVGGGSVAGANGDFGGVRREINWDGVPDGFSDPNPLPGDFFNVTSPRGLVISTPGTGLMVSANGGGVTPPLFGFPNDFQAFSAQKIFTAIASNIIDLTFFVPGTTTAATTTAFGLIFTDVEVAGGTKMQFFDADDNLIFSRDAIVAGNQGLTFLGAIAGLGDDAISRVRITAGINTIVANGVIGNPNDDVVAMDDFLFATPTASTPTVPDSGSVSLLLGGGFAMLIALRRRFLRRAA
jgi:hypothetical protein